MQGRLSRPQPPACNYVQPCSMSNTRKDAPSADNPYPNSRGQGPSAALRARSGSSGGGGCVSSQRLAFSAALGCGCCGRRTAAGLVSGRRPPKWSTKPDRLEREEALSASAAPARQHGNIY